VTYRVWSQVTGRRPASARALTALEQPRVTAIPRVMTSPYVSMTGRGPCVSGRKVTQRPVNEAEAALQLHH
jgi:hypothetical protein